MNILWVTADRGAVGSYRCYCPAYALQDRHTAENHFIFHESLSASNKDKELDSMDVVVFQRCVSGLALEWMRTAKQNGALVCVEMDDDLFNVPRHNPAGWFWWKKDVQRMLRKELDFCDLVITSTTPLAEMVRTQMGWKTLEKTRVCANHLHPTLWGKQNFYEVPQFDNDGRIVIGWQGSATHDKDFRAALDGLRQVLEEHPEVVVRFMGNVPNSVKGVIPPDRFQWTKGVQFQVYPGTLHHLHFDIGIAPITNSSFNHSKSNIKYLEYSALEVPCVASRVYPYERTITDGVNGFLAERSDEWYEKLTVLVQSEETRKRVGRAAFEFVWRDYSYHTHGLSWENAFAFRTACL